MRGSIQVSKYFFYERLHILNHFANGENNCFCVLIGAIERRCSSGTAGKQGNGKDERLDTGLRIYGRHMLHHAGPCGHIEHIGSPDRRLFAHFLLARQDPW